MSIKKDRETFRAMLNLCYEEDYPELHKELLSLESNTKLMKEAFKYENAMREILDIIPIFADDFPREILNQLERLCDEGLEN